MKTSTFALVSAAVFATSGPALAQSSPISFPSLSQLLDGDTWNGEEEEFASDCLGRTLGVPMPISVNFSNGCVAGTSFRNCSNASVTGLCCDSNIAAFDMYYNTSLGTWTVKTFCLNCLNLLGNPGGCMSEWTAVWFQDTGRATKKASISVEDAGATAEDAGTLDAGEDATKP